MLVLSHKGVRFPDGVFRPHKRHDILTACADTEIPVLRFFRIANHEYHELQQGMNFLHAVRTKNGRSQKSDKPESLPLVRCVLGKH